MSGSEQVTAGSLSTSPDCRSGLWCGWKAAACLKTWPTSCPTTSASVSTVLCFIKRVWWALTHSPIDPQLMMCRLAFEGGDADSSGHFYVCDRTAELNEHFGDLLHKIQDLEVVICSVLRQSVALLAQSRLLMGRANRPVVRI